MTKKCQIKSTQNLGANPEKRTPAQREEKKLRKRIGNAPEGLVFKGKAEYRRSVGKWEEEIKKVEIKKRHFMTGTVSRELIDELNESLEQVNKLPYELYHCDLNFIAGCIDKEDQKKLSKYFKYYDFQEPQLEIMNKILKSLEDYIQYYFHSKFRIMNIRGVESYPGTEEVGPNRMHVDGGFPRGTYKILLYLTEAGPKTGFTRIDDDGGKELYGPPGFYLIFDPLKFRHRGVPPQEGYTKSIIEITLCPWKEIINKPIFGGVNSMFPVNI